jgi:molybdopterin-synthase adenylyltransferase
MNTSELNAQEQERYSRQLRIPGWTAENQLRLKNSRVGIAGTGGLGSAVSLYLAAAGIGGLSLCDYQKTELSNLNRQILYTERDIGKKKLGAARKRLESLNSTVEIREFDEIIDGRSAARIFSGCDLVVDCLDNLETRLVLNRFCWSSGLPLLHGGISEYFGQLFFAVPGETACLACFLPPRGEQSGAVPVTGATAGVIGSMQALESLKYLGKLSEVGTGSLRLIDLFSMQIETLAVHRRPDCPVCGA